MVVKCQMLCQTANTIVQAFYAWHCFHATVKKTDQCFNCERFCFEACIGGGGGYQYPISLEVNREVSHIPLSKLENIP